MRQPRPAPPKPEAGGEVLPKRGSATPGEPEPSPSSGAAPTKQTEIEGVKRHGWSDNEIAAMSPVMRRPEFQEAMETVPSEPTVELATRKTSAGN